MCQTVRFQLKLANGTLDARGITASIEQPSLFLLVCTERVVTDLL